MTINEAIRMLENAKLAGESDYYRDLGDAIQLGIEALKRCKVLAENNPLWAAKPLPGETE